MLRKLIIFIASSSLLSCSSIQPYDPPSSGAIAKLQVRSKIAGGAIQVLTYDDNLSCTGQKRIATNMQRRGISTLQTDTQILANQLITLSLEISALPYKRNSHCEVRLSFTPLVGHTYQIRPQADEQYCYLPLLDVSNPERPIQPANAVIRRTNRGSHCEPSDISQKTNESTRIGSTDTKRSDAALDDFRALLPQTSK